MKGLYQRVWTPVQEPVAVLVFVHGAGIPSECFKEEFAWLNARGFAVVTGDMPGHGHSPGRRGHIQRFEEYVDAVQSFVYLACDTFPDTPLFIWGYSVGGLVSIRYAQTRDEGKPPVRGYVLFAPCLNVAFPVPLWKRTLGRLFSAVWPTFTQSNGLLDEEDGYQVGVATARWYTELQRGIRLAAGDAAAIRALGKPTLVFQGLADTVVSPAATLAFVKQLPHIRLVTYDGMDHALIGGEDSARALTDLQTLIEPLLAEPGLHS